MNAPIDDQIKAEAAKSLLERLGEKNKLVRFFRYNASAKHGVPIDSDDISINASSETHNTDVSQNKTQDTNMSQPPQRTEEHATKTKVEEKKEVMQPIVIDKGDKMKGILQTLAGVAALGIAVWFGSQLVEPDEKVITDNEQSVVQPYESPYQYLEDIGEHRP